MVVSRICRPSKGYQFRLPSYPVFGNVEQIKMRTTRDKRVDVPRRAVSRTMALRYFFGATLKRDAYNPVLAS